MVPTENKKQPAIVPDAAVTVSIPAAQIWAVDWGEIPSIQIPSKFARDLAPVPQNSRDLAPPLVQMINVITRNARVLVVLVLVLYCT